MESPGSLVPMEAGRLCHGALKTEHSSCFHVLLFSGWGFIPASAAQGWGRVMETATWPNMAQTIGLDPVVFPAQDLALMALVMVSVLKASHDFSSQIKWF